MRAEKTPAMFGRTLRLLFDAYERYQVTNYFVSVYRTDVHDIVHDRFDGKFDSVVATSTRSLQRSRVAAEIVEVRGIAEILSVVGASESRKRNEDGG